MSRRTIDVFFYGLFMDEDLLRAKRIQPQAGRKAVVPGCRLAIGRRAMLVHELGAQAFGMVFALTLEEARLLYAEPGLELYRPEPVIARFEDGTIATVTTFNLSDAPAAGDANPEYAAKLRAVLERLGFPAEYVRSVK